MEHLQNVTRIFPFILKTKHKTLHVNRAWVELEILQKKQSARLWIDRSSQANLHNKSCSNSIPTLHTNTYFEQFNHGLLALQNEVLIH